MCVKVSFTFLDMLIVSLLFWLSIHFCFFSSGQMHVMRYYEYGSLMLLFLLGRRCAIQEGVCRMIIVSGVFQAAWGILQYISVLSPGSEFFPVTGSFSNPGPYGGFMALCLVDGFRKVE